MSSPKGGALQHHAAPAGPAGSCLSDQLNGSLGHTVKLVAAEGNLRKLFVLGDLGLLVHESLLPRVGDSYWEVNLCSAPPSGANL